MRVARAAARHAVLLVFVVLALTPTAAFAFTPPDPNKPGHHYGEYLHNPHLQSTPVVPVPVPGSGGKGGQGIQNAFAGPISAANTPELPTLQFQPTSLNLPALIAANSVGKDLWWVAVILAALIAANVVLGVLWLARGGNFVLRRSLRLVPATA